MDSILFDRLKSAYERATEIGASEIAKGIYQVTYDNLDWWEREEDEYRMIFDNNNFQI